MNDHPTWTARVIEALQGEIHANARAKGFQNPNGDRVPEALALIHSEVSEALEVYRKQTTTETLMPDAFLEELADVVIRALDMAHACSEKPGDFARVLLAKVEKNRARSPMHGGRRC